MFVFSSNFMKSSVVYAASLCTFIRIETTIWPSIRFDISLQNFEKPLDIFSPQIETKRSEEYLVIILAVKRKLWAILLPWVHQEAGLKHKSARLFICLHDSGWSQYFSSWMKIVVSVIESACFDRPEHWISAICLANLWKTTFCPRSVSHSWQRLMVFTSDVMYNWKV